MIKLDLHIKAVPHQSVRVTRKGFTYQPKRIKDYKREIELMVRKQLPDHFCLIPKGTPISIKKLHYIFEYPKSFSKVKQKNTKFKTTKPDLHDNLNKALFDALEGVVWEQDQNICLMEDVRKIYGQENKIEIEIQEINDNSK